MRGFHGEKEPHIARVQWDSGFNPRAGIPWGKGAGYPDVRTIIGGLQQASYDGSLHAITTVINTNTVVDLFVRVARAQTLDQAAQARAELRDLISNDDISFIRLIPKILEALMFDHVAYSIAYRHHLVAFRSINEKHTLMAILADIILARFGYQN